MRENKIAVRPSNKKALENASGQGDLEDEPTAPESSTIPRASKHQKDCIFISTTLTAARASRYYLSQFGFVTCRCAL